LVDDIIELSLKIFLQEKAYEQRRNCQAVLESANLVTSKNHRDNLRRYFEERLDINQLSNELGRGQQGFRFCKDISTLSFLYSIGALIIPMLVIPLTRLLMMSKHFLLPLQAPDFYSSTSYNWFA
jgi:hypothetical protein